MGRTLGFVGTGLRGPCRIRQGPAVRVSPQTLSDAEEVAGTPGRVASSPAEASDALNGTGRQGLGAGIASGPSAEDFSSALQPLGRIAGVQVASRSR